MGRMLEIVTPLHKATKRDYVARMNGRQSPLHAEGEGIRSSIIGTAIAATAMAATNTSKAVGNPWRRR